MADKKKRIVQVTFTGKELLGNTVFDTTHEKAAKEAGIFEEGRAYKPLTIITGEQELLPLVEKELEEMKEGEERLVKLISKDAFGERRADLVRVIPLQNFFEQKINPSPGLVVRIGNMMGKVQSVGSGRVRIDFNHPLAGRDVEYSLRLEKEFKDKKEVSEQIYEKYYSRVPGTAKEALEDKLVITLEGNAYKNLTKVNEAIKKIAEEFGVTLEFKEGKAIEGPQHVHEHDHSHEGHDSSATGAHDEHAHGAGEHHLYEGGHYHDDGTYHAHPHSPENDSSAKGESEEAKQAQQPRPQSINRMADTLSKTKKSHIAVETTKDSASEIQRPKKKQ